MIKIEIINQTGQKRTGADNQRISVLGNKIVSRLIGDKTDSTIEIFLVSKSKIKEINQQFRQIDRKTDVLAFPLNYIPAAQERVLGTIFVSLEVANERDEALDELIIHGILHLLGFDHEKRPKEWASIITKINENKK